MSPVRVSRATWIIWIAASTVVSCIHPMSPQAPIPTVASGRSRDFQIAVRGSAVWPAKDLRITFLHVAQDSRCPVGGMCGWAGNAVLQMSANGTPFSIRVGPAGPASDPPAVVEQDGFRYDILRLEPLATVGTGPVDPASYAVLIRVTALP